MSLLHVDYHYGQFHFMHFISFRIVSIRGFIIWIFNALSCFVDSWRLFVSERYFFVSMIWYYYWYDISFRYIYIYIYIYIILIDFHFNFHLVNAFISWDNMLICHKRIFIDLETCMLLNSPMHFISILYNWLREVYYDR